jgi:putative drug exporter of the RND superfamily
LETTLTRFQSRLSSLPPLATLALRVALAAMTVLLLAPAVLVLAGAGSWWMPGWLNRLLSHVDIEGATARPDASVGSSSGGQR